MSERRSPSPDQQSLEEPSSASRQLPSSPSRQEPSSPSRQPPSSTSRQLPSSPSRQQQERFWQPQPSFGTRLGPAYGVPPQFQSNTFHYGPTFRPIFRVATPLEAPVRLYVPSFIRPPAPSSFQIPPPHCPQPQPPRPSWIPEDWDFLRFMRCMTETYERKLNEITEINKDIEILKERIAELQINPTAHRNHRRSKQLTAEQMFLIGKRAAYQSRCGNDVPPEVFNTAVFKPGFHDFIRQRIIGPTRPYFYQPRGRFGSFQRYAPPVMVCSPARNRYPGSPGNRTRYWSPRTRGGGRGPVSLFSNQEHPPPHMEPMQVLPSSSASHSQDLGDANSTQQHTPTTVENPETLGETAEENMNDEDKEMLDMENNE